MFGRATIRLGIGPHSSCSTIGAAASGDQLRDENHWRGSGTARTHETRWSSSSEGTASGRQLTTWHHYGHSALPSQVAAADFDDATVPVCSPGIVRPAPSSSRSCCGAVKADVRTLVDQR